MKSLKCFFRGGGGGGGEVRRVVIPSPNIVTNLPKPISSYNLKENHNSSVVSEILQYTKTQTVILLLLSTLLSLYLHLSKIRSKKRNLRANRVHMALLRERPDNKTTATKIILNKDNLTPRKVYPPLLLNPPPPCLPYLT